MLSSLKKWAKTVVFNYRADKAWGSDDETKMEYLAAIRAMDFWKFREMRFFTKMATEDFVRVHNLTDPLKIADGSMLVHRLLSKSTFSAALKVLGILSIYYTFPVEGAVLGTCALLAHIRFLYVRELRYLTIKIILETEHKELDGCTRPTLATCLKSYVVRIKPIIKRRLGLN
ncbi:hypothetical protein CPT_Moabite_267 [Serratia phage Moabite]|uniref:Uncharacterized protein n=1 Tax=Serratia phage Moabite TaxID=2587814 RepID=A0A4Y5TPJ0_9CAUD|nr:hypothetical protein HWC48_gp149 [Serratia phage Moabite]QDB71297.1 hypothetical protein CPT_Moabite_267 [Serratia phage Moabite]UCR74789.1 hypothetical protein [Serratia phage BUCT660]UGO54150.1 hypothetical protein HAYMO_168 [Serratia phage vB_SmaM_Haymo]